MANFLATPSQILRSFIFPLFFRGMFYFSTVFFSIVACCYLERRSLVVVPCFACCTDNPQISWSQRPKLRGQKNPSPQKWTPAEKKRSGECSVWKRFPCSVKSANHFERKTFLMERERETDDCSRPKPPNKETRAASTHIQRWPLLHDIPPLVRSHSNGQDLDVGISELLCQLSRL